MNLVFFSVLENEYKRFLCSNAEIIIQSDTAKRMYIIISIHIQRELLLGFIHNFIFRRKEKFTTKFQMTSRENRICPCSSELCIITSSTTMMLVYIERLLMILPACFLLVRKSTHTKKTMKFSLSFF